MRKKEQKKKRGLQEENLAHREKYLCRVYRECGRLQKERLDALREK